MTNSSGNKQQQQDDSQLAAVLAVTPARIEKLFRHQVIDLAGVRLAEQIALPPRHWALWIMRLSLLLGTALLLTGIVFFFAYNWAKMPVWSKFALIQGAMLLCFVAAAIVGPDRLVGQALVLSGTVLIGVFFAVFGQVYQTGANAWQLFALWAVLMFGFLLLSQSPAQWLLQWLISGFGLFLFMQQEINWLNRFYYWSSPLLAMTCFSLAVWLAQIWVQRRRKWLDCAWLRRTTLFFIHGWGLSFFIHALLSSRPFSTIIILLIIIPLFLWHYYKRADFFAEVISLASMAAMLWAYVLYHIVTMVDNDVIAAVLLMLMITVALSVALYKWLLTLRRRYTTDGEL